MPDTLLRRVHYGAYREGMETHHVKMGYNNNKKYLENILVNWLFDNHFQERFLITPFVMGEAGESRRKQPAAIFMIRAAPKEGRGAMPGLRPGPTTPILPSGPHCPDPAAFPLEVAEFRAPAERVGLPGPGLHITVAGPVTAVEAEGAITPLLQLKEETESVKLLPGGQAPIIIIAELEIVDILKDLLRVVKDLCSFHLPHQAISLLTDTIAKIHEPDPTRPCAGG